MPFCTRDSWWRKGRCRTPIWMFGAPGGSGDDGRMRWRIRPSAAGAGKVCVERLWRAAMPPSWPVLTAGIARLGEGLVAEAGSDPVGFVAVDMAGSIPLILVDPAYQRRGIGTSLLEAALERVRAGGAAGVTAASRGHSYVWPGVPQDLPAAVRFFASRGWRHSHDTLDLVTDLARYRAPPGACERAASTGVTVTGRSATTWPACWPSRKPPSPAGSAGSPRRTGTA